MTGDQGLADATYSLRLPKANTISDITLLEVIRRIELHVEAIFEEQALVKSIGDGIRGCLVALASDLNIKLKLARLIAHCDTLR